MRSPCRSIREEKELLRTEFLNSDEVMIYTFPGIIEGMIARTLNFSSYFIHIIIMALEPDQINTNHNYFYSVCDHRSISPLAETNSL